MMFVCVELCTQTRLSSLLTHQRNCISVPDDFIFFSFFFMVKQFDSIEFLSLVGGCCGSNSEERETSFNFYFNFSTCLLRKNWPR